MSPRQADHADDYFNDLSRQPDPPQPHCTDSPPDHNCETTHGEDVTAPKLKRTACIVCRKRKLKCDGSKPSCGTCSRLGHNCTYDEVRRKSGPKRGYVKELESRLAQVETQLKIKAQKKVNHTENRMPLDTPMETSSSTSNLDQANSVRPSMSTHGSLDGCFGPPSDSANNIHLVSPSTSFLPDPSLDLDSRVSWEMIGLGLEEPLPTQAAIDELHNLYFEHIHPSMPMLHKFRYRAAMDLAPQARPPVCLRYAMWCLAASVSDKFFSHQEIFYRRARKYAEADEMKGQGESFITVGHAQCWILISTYEFKSMYFPRAWMSSGRGARFALMLGLNRLDGTGLEVKQCLLPPRDWTEREERRRTFWMAYCVDKYASIGTGWPMTLDDKDIMTNLPASEEAYEKSIYQPTLPLKPAMTPEEAATLSTFAGVTLMAHFFGRNLTHLHRPEPNEREDDIQGEFWKRHRKMDNTLLNTALSLPPHLRLPAGIREANVVFLNMSIHTSTICLHQAAIFKAENNKLSQSLIEQSQTRCLIAATEVTTVMRLVSHLETASMNPFVAFCLYVSARVFIQFLKKVPDEEEIRASLEYLLSAMNVLKRRNPLSESFLVQLTLEMEGTGLDALLHNPNMASLMMKTVNPAPLDNSLMKCSPYLRAGKNENLTANNSPWNQEFHRKGMPSILPTNDKRDSQHKSSPQVPNNARTINLTTREQRQPQQLWGKSPEEVVNLKSLLPHTNWSQNSSNILPNNVQDKTIFDMNMSDNTSDGRQSTGQTPSTNNSSNTSFSPPQVRDDDHDLATNAVPFQQQQQQRQRQQQSSIPAPTTTSFFSITDTNETGYPSATTPHPLQPPPDSMFDVPLDWPLGTIPSIPDDFTTGLSPPMDVSWVQLLDAGSWNAVPVGDGEKDSEQWTSQQGPVG